MLPWRLRPGSGRTKLNISFLRRKLGEPAWKVWLCLVKKRDRLTSHEAVERGEVWYGSKHISEELHFPPKKTRKALARLSNLGLVRPVANEEGRDPGWTHRRGSLVYARTIYGSLFGDVQALVPRESARKLHKAGRGGARAGAGRPRKETAVGNSKVGTPISKGGTSRKEKQELLALAEQEPLKRPAGEEAGRTSFSSSSGSTGSFLGTTGQRPEIPPEALRQMPPQPSLGLIDPPIVPQPPDLPDDDEQDYAILGTAFQAAARYLTGKAQSPFARKGMTPAELERTLGACAAKLREHHLPPIVWAVWSIRTYNTFAVQKNAKRKRTRVRLPPMKWVFNPKRVEERHGWCRSEMGCELGGGLCIPPSALELQRRWNAMRSEVYRLAVPSAANVGAVVQTWFPDGLYDALVGKAIEEAKAKREALGKGLARGDWIWEAR